MSDFPFGYCTNVHAGVTLEEAQANLDRVAAQVHQLVAPRGQLPVGLWLAEQAAAQLKTPDEVARFSDWLKSRALKPYTFNGFPQGNFHQSVVKYAVYEPNWLHETRVAYTQSLATILAGLLPEGQSGSISTLPLGWPHQIWHKSDFQQAGANLQRVAEHLHRLAESTGRHIVLALEPEPGCVLDTAPDMIDFFNSYVLDDARPFIRRHLTVCHDICHSAVMFEPQHSALSSYRQQGIRVGKVQVSSAIEVPWQNYHQDRSALTKTLDQLRTFNEPRYLHQTTRRSQQEPMIDMVDDLPIAMESWLAATDANINQVNATHDNTVHGNIAQDGLWPEQAWRIHFHVPIYVDTFGQLRATQADITQAVGFLEAHQEDRIEGAPWFTGDYEVETYAWGVLPAELQASSLAEGIARELQYLQGVLNQLP